MAVASVLLADHHAVVREAIRLLLEQRDDLRVVGEARDAAEAVELSARLQPDLLLAEQGLPGMPAGDTIRKALEAGASRVLILSVHDSRPAMEEALRAGAAGYVVKTATSGELLEAVDQVREGRSYLSPSVAHHLVSAISSPGDAGSGGAASLTGRERQVVQLIAEGLSSKEIAASLGVSHKTVESHRASVMEKLDIHKASMLVRFAIREGFVTP